MIVTSTPRPFSATNPSTPDFLGTKYGEMTMTSFSAASRASTSDVVMFAASFDSDFTPLSGESYDVVLDQVVLNIDAHFATIIQSIDGGSKTGN